jgi:hypothetical protein
MALLRTDDGNLAATVAVIQRRGFCHFTNATQRTQQLPTPEVGTVSVIGTVFEYWTGTVWAKFPPP